MAILLRRNDDTVQIILEGSIDIAAATELKAAILDGLATAKKISVSLSSVTDLDVTAFQLLWALQCEAQPSAVELVFVGPLLETVRTGLSSLALPGLAVSE